MVMTTFEGSRWVDAQVSSVLAQTCPVDELLVYDDGSTDGTVELLEARGVEVHRNAARLGTVRSLEQGLRASTADVVLLADQDDVWVPRKVERLLQAEADLVFSDGRVVDAAGLPTGATLWGTVGFGPDRQERLMTQPLEVLLEGNAVTGATVLVSRRLLDLALPLPQVGWHDYWLALVAASAGLPVRAVPEPLVDYRVHGTNAAGLPPTTLRGRLAGAAAARAYRGQLLAMLAELEQRFPSAALTATREHLLFRQGLPSRRARRLWPVLGAVRSGAYAARGGSWRTGVVDLLEPRSP